MVGLNGRALSLFEQEQVHHESTPSFKSDGRSDQDDQFERLPVLAPRRSSSTQTSHGPKPLLPRSLKEALQLADLLSKSKLIPKGFETPETCLVGILYGMEVGLSPIAALQRMAVIDGRPTIWGDAALALVQASGLLQSIKEEVIEGTAMNADSESVLANTKGSEGSTLTSNLISASTSTSNAHQSNLTAICTVRREGRSEPVIGTFSVEDAKRAGLWLKSGPWTDYPKRMLIMRARAFALRDAFPDVLAGLYIREEFEGSEKRQSRLPHDQPKSEDADWHSFDIRRDFGKTNPNISSSLNALSLLNSDSGSETAQSKAPSLAGNTRNDAPRPSRPQQQQTVDPRRAPPPPPPLGQQSEEGTESDRGTESEKDPVTHADNKDSSGTAQSPVDVFGENIEEGDAETHLDPETLLDLFDSALCCALNLPTFEEIVDDFAGRLTPLSKDYQKRAQKIIDRHHRRVEDLDQSYLSAPDNKIQPSDLPRGLKSILPSLGIGRRTSTRRLETRGNRLSRSLASWNARQPLIQQNVKLNNSEEVPAQDHTPEDIE